MKYPIHSNKFSKKLEFYQEVLDVHQRATNYLNSFKWCKRINNSSLYLNLGELLCIFLYDIDNSASADDNKLWVIVGDLPSMYLNTDGPQSTIEVIEDYVRLADDWIHQVKTGGSLEECYPFRAQPTLELADMLERRTAFMKNALLENIEDIRLPE